MAYLEKIRHKCEKCGKAFTSPTKLNTHMKSHDRNQIQECPFCSIKFKILKIDSHIENVHPEPDKLLLDKTTITNQNICNICKISFDIKSDLIKHKKKGHRSLKKQEKIHQKDKKRQSDLKIVSKKTSKCNFCGKKFGLFQAV